ncbi:MAG: alpha/beta hydrolase [Pseudomonadota bacterium]
MSNVSEVLAHHSPIDRRAIPQAATESIWSLADEHKVRRIDWPGASDVPRGSILFFPGRGDHYEKYIESLEEWHRAGWRVTASDWRGQAGSGANERHSENGQRGRGARR